MLDLLSKYDSNTKGNFKYKLFFQQYPKFIFEYFDTLVEKLERIY